MFRVTEEWIKAYQSGSGSWNAKQLMQIGIAWPPRAGWIRRSQGKMITLQAKKLFEEFQGQNKKQLPLLAQTLPEGAREHLESIGDEPPWEGPDLLSRAIDRFEFP